MKIWTCGISPRSGSQNALTQNKNVNGASRLSEFWNLFGVIHIIFRSDWRPWMKSCYIIMTGRQSNNQWSGGIAAHRAPKRFGVQKSAGKIIASMFWVQDGILFIDYLPRSETVNAEYYLPLLVQLKDFLRKNAYVSSPSCVFLEWKRPGLPGYCNQNKLAYLGFQRLDHPPYSPDLAPSHYHLFRGLKIQLNNHHISYDA